MASRSIRSQSSSFSGKFGHYFFLWILLLGLVLDFCTAGIFATAETIVRNKDDATTTSFISFEEWLWLHKPRREQDSKTNERNNPLLFYSTAKEFFEREAIYRDNLLRWESLNSIAGGARYGPETEVYADRTPDEFANLVASCYRNESATKISRHTSNSAKPRSLLRFKQNPAEQAPDTDVIDGVQNSSPNNMASSSLSQREKQQQQQQQQQEQEPFTIMDIDWRAHAPPAACNNTYDNLVSYVTPVKNQGPHGTCWSFAAAENLEGLAMRQFGNLQNISEQEFISCCEECQGAAADRTFEWLLQTTDGVPALEDSYPYVGNASVPCRADTAKRANAKLHSFGRVVDDEDTTGTAILAALRQHGPMGMGVDAKCFHGYQSGIVRECQSSHGVNHAVLMVAAGTDLQYKHYYKYYSKNGNFAFPQSVDFFVIKNSWGGAWGEDGYVRIERGRNWWGPVSVIYTQ